MAILARNLFIFFLFTIFAGVCYLMWTIEHRLQERSYSEFCYCLNHHDISDMTFTGNRVVVSHRAGKTSTNPGLTYVTMVPNPEELIQELKDKNIRIIFNKDHSELIIQGLALLYIVLLILVIVLSLNKIKREGKESKFATDKLILPDDGHKVVTFKDVAGIPEALEELQEIVAFLKDPTQFSQVGATIPKGVLLQGPPGTGKTLLARAIAGESEVPFYSFSGSDFVEMFVGVGASRVRDLFKEAKRNAPCIVFIDEIDAVGGSRSGGSSASGSDERSQTLNALLVEMDGFGSSDNIVVMAATNRPDILDSALRRPGRFDRQVNILPPDINGRQMILTIHAAKIKMAPDLDLQQIAQTCPGFTGAELANLVNEAALMAARGKKQAVDYTDFELARDRLLMGVERKGMIMTDKDRNILAYHEAGHAIIAKSLPDADPLHKITIIPRGRALGQTQQLALFDRHAYSYNYLKNRITILMGGRAAEALAFAQRSTGAQGDILQATEIATNMICKWGMNDAIGAQAFMIDDIGFLGGVSQRLPMADETARSIDYEIKTLLATCYEDAMAILSQKFYLLKNLAGILVQVETLDNEEFDIICACSEEKKAADDIFDKNECPTCPAAQSCIHSKIKKKTPCIL
ncbi:MAG: ATP-dependent zinc metalloprotease FtsH [Proteobacteria bacterium]|nr:ATP-dependent zinc metalloprotease FtsH [Desulfocapsa sp.]MBU3945882.1 ATP-dependent zinc metalloprotease FtsH [Pseudomonadota bacterium]MCG2745593.1 ATP-dependent zinc metalloprotease FtsH [Desulfobacteraceae bacterium]MBU4027729.1 ATP-dependent zinc metalloprotease FtsH [Pseudomonadota bacterium]MBU4042586.1 ATP-dependent zinc metalloprotease FtsH [Pseudomonadota bacterium]